MKSIIQVIHSSQQHGIQIVLEGLFLLSGLKLLLDYAIILDYVILDNIFITDLVTDVVTDSVADLKCLFFCHRIAYER